MVDALRKFTSSQAVIDEAVGNVAGRKVSQANVELFHYSDSLCSQKVRVALKEKGVAWQSRFVNLAAHENLRPDYVRINPRAVVPTLVVDGVVIIDSATIIRFIDAHFAGPELTPTSQRSKLQMEEWIDRGDRAPLRVITYRELGRMSGAMGAMMRAMLEGRRELLEYYQKENPELADRYEAKLQDADNYETQRDDDNAYQSAMDDMERTLDLLDVHLAGREWIGGDQFTLADVVWMPNIARLKLAKLDSLWGDGARPNVARYWNRLKTRPSFIAGIKAFNTPPHASGMTRAGAGALQANK